MKRWKLVKDQLDSKRNASTDSSRPGPPYMGGGISSASFSDFRELPSGSSPYGQSPSTSNLMLPVTKSTSRASLDFPGRLNNFISKSSSSMDLSSSAASALRKLPRPRVRTNSNNLASNEAFTSKMTSPRKWVNSLLNQSGPSTQQLETTAQARSRAESGASTSSPAPVSSLVLASANTASSSRQVYTIDSGLQPNTSNGGRSASIYSSHLSSASRSTPDLHRNSVTRHRDNGALLMDLSGPLPSIAHRIETDPPPALVVRNLDAAPRGTYTPDIPPASASAQLRSVSKLRNPWSPDSPQITSEQEDEIDASIAHDRSRHQLAPGEQAVLDMLDSLSGAGSAVSAPVPPTPYQTATPGTLTRSRSFAASTSFQSPASEYSQDFRSPFLAGTSSPAAGVREAVRQRELLDSGANGAATSRPGISASRSMLSDKTSALLRTASSDDVKPLRTSHTSSSIFYQRHAQATSGDESKDKRISRVPVPSMETKLLSPPPSAASSAFPRRGLAAPSSLNPISPIDSSLLGSSANATSLWSRPGNAPDTPSTTQDPTSPMPWSSSSSIPPKWPTSIGQTQLHNHEKSTYAVEPVVTPSEIESGDNRRLKLLHPTTTAKPNLLRHRTDFTEATSIYSGSEEFSTSQGTLQKETSAETQGTPAEETKIATEAPTLATSAAISRPLSHAVSVSSSLAAIRGLFSKGPSVALPTTEASGSLARPADTVASMTPSTSVAAVAKELEQRSTTPSRPSSPEKLAMPSSPTKAKDLIAMFESNSATASPTEQSFSFSRNVTPKSKLASTRCGSAKVDSALKRHTPLSISVSRSNLGIAGSSSVTDLAAEESLPAIAKLRAHRFEAGRIRARRAGLVGVGGDGDDASFNDGDDGHDENAVPDRTVSAERSVSGRFRSLGTSSQLSQSQSMNHVLGGNVLGSGQVSSPVGRMPMDGRRGSSSLDKGDGSIGASSGSLARKGAFRNSVIGFMGVLSGKPTPSGAGDDTTPGSLGQSLAPPALFERRDSTKSDQDDNLSTASAATQGTTASYRRKKEDGNLPLTSVTAIQMSGEQPGTKPIRAGVLYYFNVHDPSPRWLRVKAVLLPSAVAMSWIPAGGGRENVVLDLRACREVHSVPSPDHPSSASDVGAASARRQGLGQINPFQLIFDDGVERLAADSAKERVQWVASVWDVAGAGGARTDSPHGSALANSGHDAGLRSAPQSPASRTRGLADSSPTRPLNLSQNASPFATPQRPLSMRPGSNEEAIDRIGSIWKSEMSSELTNKDAQPSFGEAMTGAAASAPPPLPPKEPFSGLVSSASPSASKSARSLPTPTIAGTPIPILSAASSAPAVPTLPVNSPARAKVRSWQRPPLDLATGFVHNLTPQTPILVQPAADTIRSTPASYSDDKSSAPSSVPTSKGDESPAMSSPDLDGYESARSQGSEVDDFGPRSPVSEAMFNWSRLDKESDLNPSDSASQRPARSEFGTIKSIIPAAERKREHGTATTPQDSANAAKTERTPAQVLRDSVIHAAGDNALTERERLGTVIEETQSQAQSTRLNASLRSNRSKIDEMIARAIGTGSIEATTAKSALSLVSTGSIKSQEVNKLLEFLEAQQRARLSKEKELEEQIRGFQQVVSDLQRKNSLNSSARRSNSTSTAGGESKITNRSTRDSELAAMQKKLDKVLDLVTNVVAAPVVHQRASESTALVSGVEDDGALAKLLNRVKASDNVAMSPHSREMVRAAVSRDPGTIDEWDRMPIELRGNELIKSMEDRARHGIDGRHEAIQADYLPRSESTDMVRVISAPAASIDPQGGTMDPEIEPRRRLSEALPRRVSGASTATDLEAASAMSRLPPRSWTSERGIPSPPPNSEWDAKSLLSRPASRAATPHAPAHNFRMLGDPAFTQGTPRPMMVTSEPSYGSLDMEAEIRRRRAQQQAASGASVPSAQQGGWFTPKVAQTEGHETQESSSSVTVEAPNVNLDKPVPPTPTVRWAVEEPQIDAKLTDGLGLSMSGAAAEAQLATPGSPAAGTNAELATVLQALKQSEMARQTQLQQQTEISRYLNELNAWLERDVVDRSKEWRTLAGGVTQLHDELKALKEGRALPSAASTPALQVTEASEVGSPLSPKPAAKEKQLFTMGDKANARRRPAGTRKWNGESPKPNDASTWYKPDSDKSDASPVIKPHDASTWYTPHDEASKPTLKSRAAKAAAAASGALLIRHALREWERFKMTQRAAGKPEDPLPAEATGDPAVDSRLPLPEPVLKEIKDAADKEDNVKVGALVRGAAEAGYGTQAIIELTKHVESKSAGDNVVEEEDGEMHLPTSSPSVTHSDGDREDDDGVMKMATPVPARVAAKEKPKSPHSDKEEGPTTAALALAVEEILKHLLTSKEEAKKKQQEVSSSSASSLSLPEKDKTELVNLLYTRLSADKAAETAKAKELDPKTAIESLVSAINAQKETELRSAAAADAALRQMTADLLKTTSEQNTRLVEAVSAASRDMLRQNVQQHAEEFKRLLHKEVSGMFEDVGRIREAKRHLEFEIADLWSIKSRHLQNGGGGGGGMPISYNVPGGFPMTAPQGMMGMGMGVPMGMPVPQVMHPPAHITAIAPGPPHPAPATPAPAQGVRSTDGVDSLRAQKRAVKAALRQAVAESAPLVTVSAAPAPAPAPAATAPPTPTNFLAKRKDVLNPFSINFGPRQPAK